MTNSQATPISLKIDHVAIAGPDLLALTTCFAAVGLAADYGGPHSNNITHMALLGFDDGSYIELISAIRPDQNDAIFWGQHIAQNGGPCAWAVQVDNTAAEAARVAGMGVPVSGPAYYHRRRPDGVLVEWNLAFLGNQGAGAKLPFIIADITPRQWRVHPSASVTGGPLTGVAAVVLGVNHLANSVELFQRVYGWAVPMMLEEANFGARLAWFEGTSVLLAQPLSPDTWLAERLAHFGESPCAYLLAAPNFEPACGLFGLQPVVPWFNRPLAWFDPNSLNGVRLGLMGV